MRMMPVSDEVRCRRHWIPAIPKLALLQFSVAGMAMVGLLAVWCSCCGGNSGYFSFFFDWEYRPVAYMRDGHATYIEMPVLYAYSLLLLAIQSLIAGVGVAKRKCWAWAWARATPVMAAPLWMAFTWYLAEFFTLARANYVVCSCETSNPLILLDDIRSAALYSTPLWFLVGALYLWRLRRSEGRSGFTGEGASSPKARAKQAFVLVVGVFLILFGFRMPDMRMLIHDTASYGWTGATRLLTVLGQSPNARTRDGATPLHFASRLGRLDTVVCLLRQGAGIDSQDIRGHTAIMLTAQSDMSYRAPGADSYATFIELIRRGADVRIRDKDGLTLANHIVGQPEYRSELVELMVERGVPVNVGIADQWVNFTLLGYAVEHGKPSDVDYLLSHGAKMYPGLVVRANPRMLGHLLDRGLEARSSDEDGRTPLHYVLEREIVNGTDDGMQSAMLLLQHGADINAKDMRGQTLLHLAVEYWHDEWVSFLLSCGADPNARDSRGRSSYDIVVDAEWREGCQIIRESGKLSRR